MYILYTCNIFHTFRCHHFSHNWNCRKMKRKTTMPGQQCCLCRSVHPANKRAACCHITWVTAQQGLKKLKNNTVITERWRVLLVLVGCRTHACLPDCCVLPSLYCKPAVACLLCAWKSHCACVCLPALCLH